MWPAWVLWRLDVLRSHRVWCARFPTLLPTRRHVVAVMVLFVVTIAAAATAALTAALSAARASGPGPTRTAAGTVVIVSHAVEQVRDLAPRLVVLDRGHLTHDDAVHPGQEVQRRVFEVSK